MATKPTPDKPERPIPDTPENVAWACMQGPPKEEWDYLKERGERKAKGE